MFVHLTSFALSQCSFHFIVIISQQDRLRRCPDLPRLSRQLSRATQSKEIVRGGSDLLQLLFKLYVLLLKLPSLLEDFSKLNGSSTTLSLLEQRYGAPLLQVSQNFSQYIAMIEQLLDHEAITTRRQFVVSATFLPQFSQLYESLKKKRDHIQSTRTYVEQTILEMEEGTVKLNSAPQHGVHLRVSKKVRTQNIKPNL